MVSQGNAFADKIYLKSGNTLEGKIIEKKESYNPARSYCEDWNNIVVWESGTYHCVPKDGVLWSEKEFKKPEGLALLAKDDKWGTPKNGYVTQLIPQSDEYVTGKPMKFGLVLKNVSTSLKWYDHQSIIHNSLIIKSADNNEPYYKAGCSQTIGAEHPIDAGEIVTLFDNRNITDEYVIIRPGKYTIQFRGGVYGDAIDSNFPASDIIEFEVKPGTPDERDILITSLIGILPDKCWQAATSKSNSPARQKEKEGISILFIRNAHLIRDIIIAILKRTTSPAEANEPGTDGQVNEYLGKNASGYFYITLPPKALDYWPKMKEDIAEALKIDRLNK